MGLDISHDTWHGAYSAFMRWRQMVAKLAGIPLMLMDSFYGNIGSSWEDTVKGKDPEHMDAWPFGRFYKEIAPWLPLKWEDLKPDPLHVLLNHSDCDGEIAAEHCGPIADRLKELLPKFPNGGSGGHIENWKDKTAQFIKGLRTAAAAKEVIEFC